MRRIGGTDVGPIISLYRPEMAAELAKYANATDVWLRLVHKVERPKTAVMQRGIDAEPRLRKAFIDAYGLAMADKPMPWVVAHPTFPWATCSPDDVSGSLLVEYKSTSTFARHKWGDPDSDVIPSVYNLQVQCCMEILDLPLAHVFVGFGRDYEENGEQQFLYEQTVRYIVARDRELAEMALGYCQKFHDEFVEGRKPPPLAPVSNKRDFARLMKEANK